MTHPLLNNLAMVRFLFILSLLPAAFAYGEPSSDHSRHLTNLQSAITKGQALEDKDKVNLDWRGQGLSPWCFAFAEEQISKDDLCQEQSCENDANHWMVSIFDIALAHEEERFEEKFDSANGSNLSRTQAVF